MVANFWLIDWLRLSISSWSHLLTSSFEKASSPVSFAFLTAAKFITFFLFHEFSKPWNHRPCSYSRIQICHFQRQTGIAQIVAEQIGCDERAILNIENDHGNPKFEVLCQIIAYLHIPADQFFPLCHCHRRVKKTKTVYWCYRNVISKRQPRFFQ